MRYPFFALIGCFLGTLAGCQKKVPPPPAPPEVIVATPIRHEITRYAYFTGRTDSVADVSIRARVKGFLKAVHFQEGGTVQKGQVLFEIDPQEYEADLHKAQADWQAAVAKRETEKFNYERMKDAHHKGVATDMEYADAKGKYDQSVAAVAQCKAAWELANINLGYCSVLSPVTGKISKQYVDVGNLVGSGEATLLATVVQQDPMYVYFDIDEKSWLRITTEHARRRGTDASEVEHRKDARAGAVFQAGVSDGEEYEYQGLLDYAANKVDPNTGTIEVRGILPNSNLVLLPGLFTRVRIPYDHTPGAMLIPDAAVGYDQTGSYVYVVNDQNLVEHRVIEVGEKVGRLREVTKGLDEKDRFILQGLLRARPGRKVSPKAGTFEPPEADAKNSAAQIRANMADLEALERRVPTSAPFTDLSTQPATLPSDKLDLLEGVLPTYDSSDTPPADAP
ncbi:MAG: efflux RND transporter periplasmic adaptor subunit [Phycisphaerae bacterium]|nr:efflux RND transporter periplasmic adaptor subunit [Phycisphaerae bacterium]